MWFEQDIMNAETIKKCIKDADYPKGVEYLLEWQDVTKHCIKIK